MKTIRGVVAFLILAFVASASVAHAEDLKAVRARMESRLAQLDALKASGAIGENNRGFVEVRGSAGGDAVAVVEAENQDRKTVYAALAEKTGTPSDQVGRHRARKIAQESKAGVWVQGEDGSWKKK